MFLPLRDDDWIGLMGWWCLGLDLAGMLCGSRAEPGMLSRSRALRSLRDGVIGCGLWIQTGFGRRRSCRFEAGTFEWIGV